MNKKHNNKYCTACFKAGCNIVNTDLERLYELYKLTLDENIKLRKMKGGLKKK